MSSSDCNLVVEVLISQQTFVFRFSPIESLVWKLSVPPSVRCTSVASGAFIFCCLYINIFSAAFTLFLLNCL